MARFLKKELYDFLKDPSRGKFVYGTNDCALWCCHWIEQVSGINPAAHLINSYFSEYTCARLLHNNKGLKNLSRKTFSDFKFMKELEVTNLEDLMTGDIVLLEFDDCDGSLFDCVMGIRVSNSYAFLGHNGIFYLYGNILPIAAWRIQ